MTEEELINLGFTNQFNPFRNVYEYVLMIDGDSYIRYNFEDKIAYINNSEFCVISRICETIEELLRFVECIKFLFNYENV